MRDPRYPHQISRKGNDTFQRSDADIWDRFGQAMNSARDLIEDAARGPHSRAAYAIVPVVVDPDKRFWQIRYDDDGSQLGEPEQVDYCPYFINCAWDVGSPEAPIDPIFMSHLEVVTPSGLNPRMDGQFFQKGGVFGGGAAVFNRG